MDQIKSTEKNINNTLDQMGKDGMDVEKINEIWSNINEGEKAPSSKQP